MSALDLTCRCGTTAWEVRARRPGTLVTCHCRGCQSYLRHLGREDALDAAGGTLIFQTLPDNMRIASGADTLAALRVTPKGVVRVYAACCATPVANVMQSPALPFVGLVLPPGTEALGTCRNFVYTKTATAPVKERGFARVGWGVIGRGLWARLTGRGASPFFENGELVCAPRVLDSDERAAAGYG